MPDEKPTTQPRPQSEALPDQARAQQTCPGAAPSGEAPSGAAPSREAPTIANSADSDLGSDARTALARSLDQLAGLLERLDDDHYSARGISGFDSSIGQHVRHCLDHVDALLMTLGRQSSRRVEYDRRVRGTSTETDREEGLRVVRSRAAVVRSIDAGCLEHPLQIVAIVDPAFPEREFQSSCSRELLYVFHHTVHHLAIVAAQARCLGIGVDREFGRAPATVAADRIR